MDQLLGIAAFSVLGALSRFGIDQFLIRTSQIQGLSTLIVNIFGSFLAGVLVALASKQIITSHWQTLFLVGFCGSFTTFSAYSIQSLKMLEQGQITWTVSFLILNPVLSLLAAYLGMLALKV